MSFDSVLDEIKSRIDIVEFISNYVQLTKAGQNYKGLCPFHSENIPSFTVSQSKQIFHCFGCSTGGDIFSFLVKHENLTFPEAVQYLAEKAGIQIPVRGGVQRQVHEKRNRIYQANEEALRYFMTNLKHAPAALAYLKKRGISEQSIETFMLGFAPRERNGLCRHMKKKGYADSFLQEIGLAVADKAACRDMFWKRIMFPICTIQNDIIGFGGRVMDDSLPKYINSPETQIFKKRKSLFALNIAKEHIRKKGFLLLVEGYLDAILCHQYHFNNTAAPLGTALTTEQVQRLKTLCRKVILVYDGDNAGIAAARKSLCVLLEADIHVRVVLLPAGDDPDSFLRKHGSDFFQEKIKESLSAIDFFVSFSSEEKNETIRNILSSIVVMDDQIYADQLLRELADKSRVHEPVLRSELEKIRSKKIQHQLPQKQKQRKVRNRLEYLLLNAIISFPEKRDEVFSQINIDDLEENVIQSIFRKIKNKVNIDMQTFLKELEDSEKALVTEAFFEPQIDLDNVDKVIYDCIQLLYKRKYDKRKGLAEMTGDIHLLNALLNEKRKISKKEHQ